MNASRYAPIDYDRYINRAQQIRRAELDRLWDAAFASMRRRLDAWRAAGASKPVDTRHAPRAC